MGEAKRHGVTVKSNGDFAIEAPAENVAVAMLDIEADKSLPERDRAFAQFTRLMAPMIAEACDAISKRHGAPLVMTSLGHWLGELMIATLAPNMEDFGASPSFMSHIVAVNVLAFETAAMQSLGEFEKSRGILIGSTKVSFK